MNELNEAQLAELLSRQLDTLLAGEAMTEPVPAELADLLPVAQDLTAAAPVPRPEFSTALKESLVGPEGGGGNGTTGLAGSSAGKPWVLMIIGGLLVGVLAVSLLVGLVVFKAGRSVIFGDSSPTSPVTPAESRPEQFAPLPLPPTATGPASPTQTVSPQATETIILDVLPPITATLEAEEDIPPPELVPGSDTGSDDDDDESGDRNRGHGNDPDHHDEDNPGRGGDD